MKNTKLLSLILKDTNNLNALNRTSLQVPDTKECVEYFRLSSNKNTS